MTSNSNSNMSDNRAKDVLTLEGFWESGPKPEELDRTASNYSQTTEVIDVSLDSISTGIAIVDLEQNILKTNRFFCEKLGITPSQCLHADFYDALGENEIEGPNYCPFNTVRKTGATVCTQVKTRSHVFKMFCAPIWSTETGDLTSCRVELQDITEYARHDEVFIQLQKFSHSLTDLSLEELGRMSVSDRTELLKSRIGFYLRKLLNYDIVEFRLLNHKTNELEPLLSFGMAPESTQRKLYASAEGNGITGYVAYNKRGYYCEDTTEDQYYIQGAVNARSSLTLPLMDNDEVIGTCNVESLKPAAFDLYDHCFLQMFLGGVATAIHTFDLLSYEGGKAAFETVQTISNSVSLLVDTIIQLTSGLVTEYIGHDSEMFLHLNSILKNAREIKDVISSTGTKVVPQQELKDQEITNRPILNRRRILVIDKEKAVLRSAHELLERYHCIVETAPDALTALNMVKASEYDVIICEIKPDGGMSGYQFMLRLIELWPEKPVVPLLIMKNDGWEPEHTIVSARLKGLLGVLHKPFLCKQLLQKVELVINTCSKRDGQNNLIPPEDALAAHVANETQGSHSTTSGTESRVQVKGFYLQQKLGRFDEWDKLAYPLKEDLPPMDNDAPGRGPAIDAT